MYTLDSAFDEIPLLSDLSRDEKHQLLSIAQIIEIPNGKFLSRAGSAVDEISFILVGGIKLCQATPEGKEMTIALLGPGAHIGVVSFLNNAIRTTDVIATCRSTLLSFNAPALRDHLRCFPALTYGLLLSLSTRLHQTTQHMTENALYDLNYRLAHRLLELAVVVEFDDKERLLVRQRPSHQELANMLGVSREAITRSLKKLEEQEHIEIADDQIFVISTPLSA